MIIEKTHCLAVRKFKVKTKFGEWMADNMCKTNMTQKSLADLLHISRSYVTGHINGAFNPTYINVLAYCWAFDSDDDPDVIWELRNEEL